MNRFLGFIIFFSVLFCFTSVFAQNDVSDARKYIEQMNDKIESQMLEGNVEGMTDYYAEDVISLPSYEPMIKGRSKIMQKAKKEIESGFKFNSVQFKTQEVFGSGNHVYEVGEYDMTMVIPEMPQPVSDQGKYLCVWEKQSDGNWKVVADMWNTNKNPWMEDETEKDMKSEKKQ